MEIAQYIILPSVSARKKIYIGDILKRMYAADFTENQALPESEINESLSEVSVDLSFLNSMEGKLFRATKF